MTETDDLDAIQKHNPSLRTVMQKTFSQLVTAMSSGCPTVTVKPHRSGPSDFSFGKGRTLLTHLDTRPGSIVPWVAWRYARRSGSTLSREQIDSRPSIARSSLNGVLLDQRARPPAVCALHYNADNDGSGVAGDCPPRRQGTGRTRSRLWFQCRLKLHSMTIFACCRVPYLVGPSHG